MTPFFSFTLPYCYYYYQLPIPTSTATADDIRAAYLKLAASMHPDKYSQSPLRDDAERQFIVIDKAYKVVAVKMMVSNGGSWMVLSM